MVRLTEEQKKLVEDHYYMVKMFMSIHGLNPSIAEDPHGFLCEALIKAVATYNPKRNVTLKSYIYQCMRHWFIDWIRYKSTQSRRRFCISTNAYNSSETRLKNVVEKALGFEQKEFDKIGDGDFYRRMVSQLDDRERDIMKMRFEYGMTLEQIANKYGLSRQRVSKIVNRFISTAREMYPKTFDNNPK